MGGVFEKRETRMGIDWNRFFFTKIHQIKKSCQTYGRFQIHFSFVALWAYENSKWSDEAGKMRDGAGLRIAWGGFPADSGTTADGEQERLTRRRGERGGDRGRCATRDGGGLRAWGNAGAFGCARLCSLSPGLRGTISKFWVLKVRSLRFVGEKTGFARFRSV